MYFREKRLAGVSSLENVGALDSVESLFVLGPFDVPNEEVSKHLVHIYLY